MKKRLWQVLAGLFVALLMAGIGSYWIFTGPQNIAQYPPADLSPYRLPWTAGQTLLCVQSNRGVVSHRGWERFAYDFAMPVGTDVCAARGGTVIQVTVDHDGHGYHWPNNVIAIRHDDGTQAFYLHVKKDGSRVSVGDRVKQGQVIALSGHVGNSMLPHVHFHVTDSGKKSTLPITFADVGKDMGIPRMFKRYTSGNTAAESPAVR
ncbi:MAG: M23 family metallopeptidase [Candidatus Hydrogenedentes bacterium]|nr:M23 family metallopeptidase [Candidatus Hydrogenedentota bacterium]